MKPATAPNPSRQETIQPTTSREPGAGEVNSRELNSRETESRKSESDVRLNDTASDSKSQNFACIFYFQDSISCQASSGRGADSTTGLRALCRRRILRWKHEEPWLAAERELSGRQIESIDEHGRPWRFPTSNKGSQKDFSKLLEYEWRLEELFQKHPELGGICQYHAETLPHEVLRQGLLTHPLIFVNQTLSRINPHYLRADSYSNQAEVNPELESVIDSLCHSDEAS
jgi:hypothetical protein